MTDTSWLLDRLNALLCAVWEGNPFYRERWRSAGLSPARLASLDELTRYPSLCKADLRSEQAGHPPLGRNRTLDPSKFVRLHRSSGTSGLPLYWLDDEDSWQALVRCSAAAFRISGVSSADRIFLSARFGASLGPWILRDGACKLGCLCIAPGEMPVSQELNLIRDLTPTVLAAKPGKLHELTRAAMEDGMRPASIGVKKIITVSEPGGREAAFRAKIESAWQAECFDRYGLTEAGTVAAECTKHPGGLHVLEDEIVAELLHPENDRPLPEEAEGELVLTHLGRLGQPIIRYRTGDIVRMRRHSICRCGLPHSLLITSIARLAGNPSPIHGPSSP